MNEEEVEIEKPEWVSRWEEFSATRPAGTWVSYMGVWMCVTRAGSAWISCRFDHWNNKLHKYWNVSSIVCEYVDEKKHFITKEFGLEMLGNNIPLEPQ
jgi:hypothetical protein